MSLPRPSLTVRILPGWRSNDMDIPPGGLVIDPTPVATASRTRRGGPGPDDEALCLFASSYRAALRHPVDRRHPISAVADATGINRSTAHRWKARAIKAGLLEGEGDE